jgi:membrane protein insertase Oxa1/YidC/SpoIIIJ
VTATDQIATVGHDRAFGSWSLVGCSAASCSHASADRRTPQANKQMATVMKVLPMASSGSSRCSFPAGLVLYFS